MKRLLLASAVLGLAGTIGTANAVPLTATDLGIWSGPTAGDTAASARQQALPASRALLPLITATPNGAASGPITLNAPSNTVGAFLASGPVVSAGCGAACQGTTLSLVNFAAATLFEFSFSVATAGTLSVTHDDGISLFADLGGGNNPGPTNLIPGASAPTFSATNTASLTAGSYDLFYTSANGLPEVLTTNFTPAVVPEPATLTLLGSALFGLGWLGRRRRKSA